jgi:hypothetical protein
VFFAWVRGNDIARAEALVQIYEQLLEKLLIHVAVAHDVRPREHAAICGNDTCVGFHQRGERCMGSHETADPPAIAYVEDGPTLGGDRSAGDQEVSFGKMAVKIAVSVCRRQVTVIDARASPGRRLSSSEWAY